MFMYPKEKAEKKSDSEGRRGLHTWLCLCISVLLACQFCLSVTAEAADCVLSNAYTSAGPVSAALRTTAATGLSLLSGLYPQADVGVSTSAHAHLLMEASSGAVLAQKNQDMRLPMASTTKIMTALVAIEALPLDTSVTIPAAAAGVEGSSVYLAEGERLTLSDLLYALLLESANDAAVAIAITVGGDVASFADMMNQKAASLGLKDTHFVNPHGLDDDEHYTTAYDLAVIAKAALENNIFRTMVSTQKKTIPLHGTEGVRLLLNHNKMLKMYDGCIGVKTGFTKKTGRCLVSAAERDGITLIAVTLGAPDDWNDHTALLDYGFSMCESVRLVGEGEFQAPVWTVSGNREYVMVRNQEALSLVLPRARGEIHCVVELPRFDFAPILDGEEIGRLVWVMEGDGGLIELAAVPLVATYTVSEVTYKESIWKKIKGLFD